mgnify:CR=1 FL=1
MKSSKINRIVRLIEIFDKMFYDLKIGRLTNIDKDVILNLHKYKNKDNFIVNIKDIKFVQIDGKLIKKSTLYKSLRNLCDKNLISHHGSQRSCKYKLN